MRPNQFQFWRRRPARQAAGGADLRQFLCTVYINIIISAKLYGRLRELFFAAVVYGRLCVEKTALVLKLEKRHHLDFFMNPRKPPASCRRNAERR